MKSIIVTLAAMLLVVFGAQAIFADSVVNTVTGDGTTVQFDPEGPLHYKVGDTLRMLNNTTDSIVVTVKDANGAALYTDTLAVGEETDFEFTSSAATVACVTYVGGSLFDKNAICISLGGKPPVPTLTEWGIIALIVVLIGVGITMYLRKRPVHAT